MPRTGKDAENEKTHLLAGSHEDIAITIQPADTTAIIFKLMTRDDFEATTNKMRIAKTLLENKVSSSFARYHCRPSSRWQCRNNAWLTATTVGLLMLTALTKEPALLKATGLVEGPLFLMNLFFGYMQYLNDIEHNRDNVIIDSQFQRMSALSQDEIKTVNDALAAGNDTEIITAPWHRFGALKKLTDKLKKADAFIERDNLRRNTIFAALTSEGTPILPVVVYPYRQTHLPLIFQIY